MNFFVLLVGWFGWLAITGSQLRRSPLDKSRRRKTEYTLATALHTRGPYTLVRPSAQRAGAIRLQEYSFYILLESAVETRLSSRQVYINTNLS